MNYFYGGFTLKEILEGYRFPFETKIHLSSIKQKYLITISRNDESEDEETELVKLVCSLDLSNYLYDKKVTSSGIIKNKNGYNEGDLKDFLVFKIITSQGKEKIRLTKAKKVLISNGEFKSIPNSKKRIKDLGRLMLDLEDSINLELVDDYRIVYTGFLDKEVPVIDYEREIEKCYYSAIAFNELFREGEYGSLEKLFSIDNDLIRYFFWQNFSWDFFMPLFNRIQDIIIKSKTILNNPNPSSPFLDYIYNTVNIGERLGNVLVPSLAISENQLTEEFYNIVIDFLLNLYEYDNAVQRHLDYDPPSFWDRPESTNENEFYNDDRDLDNQSQEFWDNV